MAARDRRGQRRWIIRPLGVAQKANRTVRTRLGAVVILIGVTALRRVREPLALAYACIRKVWGGTGSSTTMINDPKTRLIEASKNVDAHGDVARTSTIP